MAKAVFLDRDGVINREVDVLRSVKQLKLLPGVAGAIKKINKLGFLAVIITNQPVIARGWLTEKEVDEIHAVLIKRLNKKGANIDAIYYCPHHPNANLKKYRRVCSCRKPAPGMLIKAMKEWKVGRKRSFMIGDHAWDIMAGEAAGLKTILVKSNRPVDPKYAYIKPDFTAKNLAGAVVIIKKIHN